LAGVEFYGDVAFELKHTGGFHMPRTAKKLGALEVSRLTKPGTHAVGEVPGLILQVLPSGARTWVLRRLVGKHRRELGLGGYPAVTLAAARERARALRAEIAAGVDPIEQRRAARSALLATQAAAVTFKDCAERYIKAHEAGWRNAKHAQQWTNTLTQHAYPVMGALLVRDVELSHVMRVLEPIWGTTNETAVRLRGRVELVLDWATVRGFREGTNPARWRGHLDKLLPKPSKVNNREHFAALPLADMGAFMLKLRAAEGMGARALEFAILTAARSGEVRGARMVEIDREAKVWIVPGARMKAGKDHRVPLTDAALQVLDAVATMPRVGDPDLIFQAPRGGLLSDMTLTAVLRRLEVPAVPHGFRSTFRDWVAECTAYPNEAAELALAHTVGDKVEAAYRRGDMFDKRRRMMADWAAYVATVPAGNVVAMPGRRAAAGTK